MKVKTKATLGIITVLFLVSTFNVMPAFAQPTSGMVSYWKLDESSGMTAYDSVGTNDGTLVNGPVWTTGVVDGALSFDGVNDYVEIPHSNGLDITDYLTVEFWFKTNTVNRDGLVSKYWSSGTADRCWMIYLTKHGDNSSVPPRIGTCIYDSGGSLNDFALNFGQTDIQIDTWYHVVFVVSGSDVKMWLNGNLDGEKTLMNPGIQSRPTPVEIGRWNEGIDPKYYFDGLIDEVAIYNRVLTEKEIQRHYRNGLRGFGYYLKPIAGRGTFSVSYPQYSPPDYGPDVYYGDDVCLEYDITIRWSSITYPNGDVQQTLTASGTVDVYYTSDLQNLIDTRRCSVSLSFYDAGGDACIGSAGGFYEVDWAPESLQKMEKLYHLHRVTGVYQRTAWVQNGVGGGEVIVFTHPPTIGP